jgi:hypothetical protein
MIRKPKKTAHDKLITQLRTAKEALELAAIHAVEVGADHAFDVAAIKHPKKAVRRKKK